MIIPFAYVITRILSSRNFETVPLLVYFIIWVV